MSFVFGLSNILSLNHNRSDIRYSSFVGLIFGMKRNSNNIIVIIIILLTLTVIIIMVIVVKI